MAAVENSELKNSFRPPEVGSPSSPFLLNAYFKGFLEHPSYGGGYAFSVILQLLSTRCFLFLSSLVVVLHAAAAESERVASPCGRVLLLVVLELVLGGGQATGAALVVQVHGALKM